SKNSGSAQSKSGRAAGATDRACVAERLIVFLVECCSSQENVCAERGYTPPAAKRKGAKRKGAKRKGLKEKGAVRRPFCYSPPAARRFRYFRAPPRAEWRPVPRPSPIFLANSERCSAYFGATIG